MLPFAFLGGTTLLRFLFVVILTASNRRRVCFPAHTLSPSASTHWHYPSPFFLFVVILTASNRRRVCFPAHTLFPSACFSWHYPSTFSVRGVSDGLQQTACVFPRPNTVFQCLHSLALPFPAFPSPFSVRGDFDGPQQTTCVFSHPHTVSNVPAFPALPSPVFCS